MVQGYYTLEEAARILKMSPEKLSHMAQKREVRAFADRGTWRFRTQDVEEMARRQGQASDEVPSLAEKAGELAGNLPLGQQRLLEVARALAADPVVVILDEPAAGLRSLEKQILSQLLRTLRNEGMTIVLVEHDMEFVMNLVDRIVVMDFGSKLAEGVPADIRAEPRVQEAYLGGVA